MNIIKNIIGLNAKWKLLLLVVIVLVGFVGSAIYMYSLMAKVSINGPVYKEIETNKNLVSDILPPPEYIIEAYLTILQMRYEKNPESLENLINKFEALKNDYIVRHEFWKQELPNGDLKTAMTEKSYEPAMTFLDIVEKQYIPAVRSHDTVKIDSLINSNIRDAYEKHRAIIDDTVKLANDESSIIEKNTNKTILWAQISSIFFALIILWLVISIAFYIQVDITESKKIEEQLKVLDKLKDDFLMITTHELKTPLVPIKSQCQLLLAGDYGKLNEEQRNATEMIYRNEEALNALVSEVLDIAKIKSNKMQIVRVPSQLEKIVANVVADFEATAQRKHITLSLAPSPELPKMFIDSSRIRQVLANLVDNAIKFTPSGGAVKVEVQKGKDVVLVAVSDTGIGIKADNIPKLFEPFFQIDNDVTRKQRGTGLGLAVSRGLVEAHGGTIKVESAGEGKGSKFIISLPLLVDQKRE